MSTKYIIVNLSAQCETPDCDGGCKRAIAERDALNEAAPEMLEALKDARDWALAEAASATLQVPNRAAEKALARFEAIIAKAEGRQ